MVNHGSVDSLGEQEGVVKFEYDHDKNTLRQVFITNIKSEGPSYVTISD